MEESSNVLLTVPANIVFHKGDSVLAPEVPFLLRGGYARSNRKQKASLGDLPCALNRATH